MKNKNSTISELIDFVNVEKINHPKISFLDETLIINAIPLNSNIVTHWFLLILGIFLGWKVGIHSVLILGAVAISILSTVAIWSDLAYVNYVMINFTDQNITITTKNIVKKLIGKKNIVHFDQIDFFSYEATNLFSKSIIRFAVSVTLKNEKSFIITDFAEKKHAIKITEYLNSLFG